MIYGELVPDVGAVLSGHVFFDVPIDKHMAVDFLVDTGSSHTCLVLPRLRDLSADEVDALRPLGPRPATLVGAGGPLEHFLARVRIGFAHEDSSVSWFDLYAPMLAETAASSFLCILGRDVLFRGQLSAGRDGVALDIAAGDHDLLRV